DEYGRAIADLLGLERLPDLLARVLVKRDDGTPLAANQAVKQVAVEQRVRRPTPDRGVDFVVLGEVASPHQLAGDCVEAAQVAHGAERVDPAGPDQRRSAWSAAVGNLVRAVVFVLPQQFAAIRIQTKDALAARNTGPRGTFGFAVCVEGALAIHDVD